MNLARIIIFMVFSPNSSTQVLINVTLEWEDTGKREAITTITTVGEAVITKSHMQPLDQLEFHALY